MCRDQNLISETNERTNGRTDERTNRRTDKRTYENWKARCRPAPLGSGKEFWLVWDSVSQPSVVLSGPYVHRRRVLECFCWCCNLFFAIPIFWGLIYQQLITHISSVTGPPLGKEDFDNARVFEEKEAKKTPEERKAAFVALMANGAWGG